MDTYLFLFIGPKRNVSFSFSSIYRENFINFIKDSLNRYNPKHWSIETLPYSTSSGLFYDQADIKDANRQAYFTSHPPPDPDLILSLW